MPANVKPILRNLWKNRTFTAINVGGLVIGLAVAVLILWWVKSELSYDNYHPDADRMYRIKVRLTESKWVWEATPLLLGEVAVKEIPEITKSARMNLGWGSLSLNINNKLFIEKNGAYVDNNWFNFFHYDFVKGSAAAFNKDPFSILLTESKAKQYFGNSDPIGQIIKIDSINYQVQAIVKDNPTNSSFQFEMLIPLEAYLSNPSQRKNDESWNNFNYITFIQLHEQADTKTVVQKLTKSYRNYRKDNNDVNFDLTPLSAIHFDQEITSGAFLQITNIKTVYIFSVMAIILLIIACINYVNLTTAKASLRAKEVSIKKIMGANRWALFRQFLIESFMVSLMALVLSLALIYFLLPVFNQLTERTFVFSITSPNIWPVLLGTLAAITLLNGIYPALMLSSFEPLKVFKGITVLKMKDASLRKSLVVLQFTLSVILITATIIISNQLKYIQEKDMGYDRSQVFSFVIPYKQVRNYDQEGRNALLNNIKHELASSTSIMSVSLANGSIVDLRSSNSGSADWDGRQPDYVPTVFQLSADEDFPKTLGLQMAQGRWFDRGNKADEHNFILNETAVRQFGIRKPVIGQRFSFQGDTGQIIGITKDFNFQSVHEKIGPLAIVNRPTWRSTFLIKTTPSGTKDAIAAAGNAWHKFFPDAPLDYSFLDERFNALYKAEKKVSTLIYIFAIVAVLITCMGLFGLIAFSAEQRVREIGIRKVLGATVANIMVLMTRDFIKLVGIAIVIAIPFSWWLMSGWLQDFAYRINLDAWIFILSAILALAIAVFTISFQAFRSAVQNPVNNLRSE
jgi:putative ABC transport system permease protein